MANPNIMIVPIICALVVQKDGQLLGQDVIDPQTQQDSVRIVLEYNAHCRKLDICDSYTRPENRCCMDCSCEPDCAIYGTCCPGIGSTEQEVHIPPIKPLYTCQITSVRGLYNTHSPSFMISQCPDDYKDNTTEQMCKGLYSNKTLDDVISAHDNATNDNYKNKYCALCNGANMASLVAWNPGIECKNSSFHVTNYDTLLDDIVKTDDCDITFEFYKPNDKCDLVISECNQTGLWQMYDPFIERACHAYLAPYASKFQNHFCAQCNEFEAPNASSCSTKGQKDFMTFTALLKLPPATKRRSSFAEAAVTPRCEDTQIYDDYKKQCRTLQCHPTRILNNGTCIQAYSKNSGLCYDLYIEFSPLQNATFTEASLAEVVQEQLSDLLRQHRMTYDMYEFKLCKLANASDAAAEVSHTDGAKFHGTGSGYLAYAMLYLKYPADDYLFIQDLYSVYDKKTVTLTLQYNTQHVSSDFGIALVRPVLTKHRANTSQSVYTLHNQSLELLHETIFARLEQTCAGDIITVTQFIECPGVKLEADYSLEIQSNGVIVSELDWFVDSAYYRETDNNSGISVCADAFGAALRTRQTTIGFDVTEESLSAGEDPRGILSLVLAMTSVFCLLVTFLTYSLFPVLRSQPGKLNMVLCVCMAAGYIFYVFGITQTQLKVGCPILAVFIHFSWVFTFFWQNVCSFHMFRDFNNLTKSLSRSRGPKVLVYYMAYAFLCTCAVLAVNVGVTHRRTNGGNYGYGSAKPGLCYLYDRYMVICTVVAPLLLLVLINVTMFVIVVVKIKRSSTIKRHVQTERNMLVVYAKLSTLTGVTWAFFIPLYLTKHVVFEYIFIVLNASQGVYVMAAFVCNQRVLNMYKGIWSKFGINRSQTRSTELHITAPTANMTSKRNHVDNNEQRIELEQRLPGITPEAFIADTTN